MKVNFWQVLGVVLVILGVVFVVRKQMGPNDTVPNNAPMTTTSAPSTAP